MAVARKQPCTLTRVRAQLSSYGVPVGTSCGVTSGAAAVVYSRLHPRLTDFAKALPARGRRAFVFAASGLPEIPLAPFTRSWSRSSKARASRWRRASPARRSTPGRPSSSSAGSTSSGRTPRIWLPRGRSPHDWRTGQGARCWGQIIEVRIHTRPVHGFSFWPGRGRTHTVHCLPACLPARRNHAQPERCRWLGRSGRPDSVVVKRSVRAGAQLARRSGCWRLWSRHPLDQGHELLAVPRRSGHHFVDDLPCVAVAVLEVVVDPQTRRPLISRAKAVHPFCSTR